MQRGKRNGRAGPFLTTGGEAVVPRRIAIVSNVAFSFQISVLSAFIRRPIFLPSNNLLIARPYFPPCQKLQAPHPTDHEYDGTAIQLSCGPPCANR